MDSALRWQPRHFVVVACRLSAKEVLVYIRRVKIQTPSGEGPDCKRMLLPDLILTSRLKCSITPEPGQQDCDVRCEPVPSSSPEQARECHVGHTHPEHWPCLLLAGPCSAVVEPHAHILELQELVQAVLGLLPAQPALLHAAKGRHLAGDGHLIHTHLGGQQPGQAEEEVYWIQL